jgi:hypothetical protein
VPDPDDTPPGSPRDAARARLAALVGRYRRARAQIEADAGLGGRVLALADFQARRLAETYADLRRDERHRAAIDFFLSDLYGPQDLSQRDRQMLAALGKLQRFLPAGALEALAGAFELHVLTLELDSDTAAALPASAPLGMKEYATAYRRAGRAADRVRQIDLIAEIGHLLDGLAHHPEIGLALRLSRAPARAAGYGELQDFLQRGYDAFRAMNGAEEFLAAIDARERELMAKLLR